MAAAVEPAGKNRGGLLPGLCSAQQETPAAKNTGKPRGALKRCIGNSATRTGSADALLLVATIGAVRDRMSEAEQALREAEKLVADTAAVAQTGGARSDARSSCYLRRGAPELAIAAFRRQVELCRRAGDVLGENVALGNLGCAQLDAGDLDAAIESLRRSVDGLRSIHAPYGLEFRLSTLAVALAWRGDDVDILPLAREAFDHLRLLGRDVRPADGRRPAACPARRFAACRPAHRLRVQQAAAARSTPSLIALPMQQRVRDRAAAEHPAATVETWLRAGERLTEEQAAAIAFDEAPLDGLPDCPNRSLPRCARAG